MASIYDRRVPAAKSSRGRSSFYERTADETYDQMAPAVKSSRGRSSFYERTTDVPVLFADEYAPAVWSPPAPDK